MKKALCILSENPDIQDLCKKIKEKGKHFREKMMFLEKQRENLEKEAQEAISEEWSSIENIIEKNLSNKLPADYNKEKYGLSFSLDKDLLTLTSHEEKREGVPEPLQMLFHALKDKMEE